MNRSLKDKLAVLPEKPGCYLMKNASGEIIYVGKAKVLKNRVRSYFTGSHNGKTQLLVSEIVDFEYIVVASAIEALLLECNLIKKHDPRYNVMLRDDKTYPYIKITNEEQPRLEITRKVLKDKAKYFGPYPNAGDASEVKKLLDLSSILCANAATCPNRFACTTIWANVLLPVCTRFRQRKTSDWLTRLADSSTAVMIR